VTAGEDRFGLHLYRAERRLSSDSLCLTQVFHCEIFRLSHRSELKRTLVVSYMSVVDALRPRLVLMENVAPMAGYLNGKLLQLCMRVMLDMGYAVHAGVLQVRALVLLTKPRCLPSLPVFSPLLSCAPAPLQAAQYGVPQSRRRLILAGSAPGYDLPPLPTPSHTFESPENKTDNHVRLAPALWL
jgi:site-specific DNA-cytosine methylase